MNVAVINCSWPTYNLGVEKIANYYHARGDEVYAGGWGAMTVGKGTREPASLEGWVRGGIKTTDQGIQTEEMDKFYFSAIFTWDIPELVLAVNMVRHWGREVEIGGPAATFMWKYVKAKTGITPHLGIDQRFEYVDGQYELTFTSRGCPHNCRFCGVSRVEPLFMVLDSFSPAPMVGDNNILATPMSHQKRVVKRLATLGEEIDFNSGFDVRFFKEEHYRLYSQLRLECWRFAFDTMQVEKDVRRVTRIMTRHGLDRHQVTFYCLIGFPGTTPEECLYRLNIIIKLGHNPYPMRFWPLNSLNRKYVAPGWNEDLLQRMSAYYQTPYLWMADSWENFKPGKKLEVSPDQSPMLKEGS